MANPPQAYKPLSWNGNLITSGNLDAWFDWENAPAVDSRTVDVVEATVIGVGDVDNRAQPRGANWVLRVSLVDTTQTSLNAFYTIFDEDNGLVEFRCYDTTLSKIWKVYARCIGRKQTRPGFFDVYIRVPDARWQEDTPASSAVTDSSAEVVTFTPTVAGSRRTGMDFTFKPKQGKWDPLNDYTRSMRGFIVNRSDREVVNEPVYLTDVNGAASRLDTSQLIKNTGVSQQLNGAINATVTTINADTDVGGGIPHDQGGMIWIDTEQIAYANFTGTQFTGCVRGVGGTTAASHSDNALIYPSYGLANGDDVNVWVDNALVQDRWLVNWNAASSSIVINISLPAATKVTLPNAITNTAPADGGSLLLDDVSQLDPSGFLVVGAELIYYSGKSGNSVTGIKRGAWSTVAAAHAKDLVIYAHPKLYTVSQMRTAPPPASAPLARRPCIQLVQSSNQEWYWGSEADDAYTAFYDADHPDRTAMWSRVLTEEDELAAFTNATVLTQMRFTDTKPSPTAIDNFNSLLYNFSRPLSNGANEVAFEYALDAALSLLLYGNTRGGEVLLKQLLGSTDGATVQQAIDSVGAIYGLRVLAKHKTITGANASGGADVAISAASPKAMTFTLDNAALVDGFAFRVKEGATAPTENLKIDLYAQNNDGTLDLTVKLCTTMEITPSDTTTSFATITKSLAAAVSLAAGRYGLVFSTADTNGYLLSASAASVYSKGELRSGAGSAATAIANCYCDYDGHTASDGTQNTPGGVQSNPDWYIEAVSGAPAFYAYRRYDLSPVPEGAQIVSVAWVDYTADTTMQWGAYFTSANVTFLKALSPTTAELDQGQFDPAGASGAEIAAAVASGYSYFTWPYNPPLTIGKHVVLNNALSEAVNLHLKNAKAKGNFFSIALVVGSVNNPYVMLQAIKHQDPERTIAASPTGLTQRGTGTYSANVKVHAVGHGFSVNNEVSIYGAGLYNGRHKVVEVVGNDDFVIDVQWTNNSGGGYVRGYVKSAYLQVTYSESAAGAFGTKLDGSAWFKVIGTPLQSDSQKDTGGQSSADKVHVKFDTTTGIYVHRTNTFISNRYHCNGVLSSDTTGEQIAVDLWMQINDTLKIDSEKRQTTFTEGSIEMTVPSAVAYSAPRTRMTLLPGTNTVKYTEKGQKQNDLTLAWSGRKL